MSRYIQSSRHGKSMSHMNKNLYINILCRWTRNVNALKMLSFEEQEILRERFSSTKTDTILAATFCNSSRIHLKVILFNQMFLTSSLLQGHSNVDDTFLQGFPLWERLPGHCIAITLFSYHLYILILVIDFGFYTWAFILTTSRHHTLLILAIISHLNFHLKFYGFRWEFIWRLGLRGRPKKIFSNVSSVIVYYWNILFFFLCSQAQK